MNTEYEQHLKEIGELGFVREISPPIIFIEGLPGASVNELVYFENGARGVVTALSSKYVEVLALSNQSVSIDLKVVRSLEFLNVPVGEGFLGTSVDALGTPLYNDVIISDIKTHRLIDVAAPGISDRVKITEPLETGVSTVDLMIPLGKGQRELIIGDRKIGKTAFLYQTILSQVKQGTIVIYAAIGKQRTAIKHVEDFVQSSKIRKNVVIVASSASDPLGLIYLTPYTAMTMAEYFRDNGKDTLVIFDDLTTHAKYYREMSLIARKFPGRESYPGDIFYAHARLLERGGLFKVGKSNVAITCLPVAETVEGDISGYIQTNLMSITDGHIFFDSDLFKQGHKPPINHFLSVTRVGRQTQSKLRWGVNRELVSFYTLFNKTQNIVHFGTELNAGIKSTLQMGDELTAFFNQPVREIVPLKIQILFFCLVWIGLFQGDMLEKLPVFMTIATEKYSTDKKFTQKIDDLVVDTSDFNTLLGKVSSQSKEWITLLEELNEEK